MKDFTFSVPQDIVFGIGSLSKLPMLLQKIGSGKVLIISGRFLERLGAVKKVADIIEASGISYETFLEVEANPSIETVKAASEAYKKSGATSIVVLGGGSPMDVAKAAGVLAGFGGEVTQYEGADRVPGRIDPIIAIPTTAGTGSEVTAFSVITDKTRNYKLTIFSNKLIPEYALLDPELIMSLPSDIAAATCMDALVHALEAYLSTAASPFSDAMAEKALELIGKSIRPFVSSRNNEEAASGMMLGSMFAGIAFAWARLGNVHAMAHPLGGFFNIPHGMANAILLPVILEYNALTDTGKYEKIYNCIKRSKAARMNFTPKILIEEIRELNQSLGIPAALSELGVTEDTIPDMARDAMKSGNILVNPRQSTQKDIEMLYKKAL
ncbi:alcohol dehydrogenase [Ruminiclostridium sufflavum DSM 19573]|uniref:Alcohol dehydrogenase n=1 Tax=Ruminiclostridium sufflavum DSM 19573 TaxID=1121337 RepID=A0A318XLZ3_9FIRM|nr:iron-containing alcohol dehydrogenase [Ruminiclostridium sufflavum]PYG88742.1 alcohol dehydrogenase [Ruminiclostridium sufflavum DSM 19573]